MLVRAMRDEDAGAVARLTTELGYPAGEDEIRRRFAGMDGGEREAVLVAEDAGEVVGWVHLRAVHGLTDDPLVEIWGLVVAARCRGTGIGQRLMEATEAWAMARGYDGVRVRSNVVRERAHRFYERLRYEKVKTSYTLVKRLEGADGTTGQRRDVGGWRRGRGSGPS